MAPMLVYHARQHRFEGVQSAKIVELHVLLKYLDLLLQKSTCACRQLSCTKFS